MRLILLRHGETLWNKDSRLQGHDNSELSEKGIFQAEKIKSYISALAPSCVFTSDLGRAIQTSKIIGFPNAIRLTNLRELNMGDWTGHSKVELERKQTDLYMQWRSGLYTPPGGESWGDFCERIQTALVELVNKNNGDILAVVHSGVIRAACTVFLNLSPKYLLPASPGTLTIFNFDTIQKNNVKLEAYNLGTFTPDTEVAD